MFLVVVCASALRPHALELCADVIDLGREEAGKYEYKGKSGGLSMVKCLFHEGVAEGVDLGRAHAGM